MNRRTYFLLISALALLWTLPWLGVSPFFTRGEPREALVAQSMLLSGNWVLGSGYAGVVPSKPPLTHWLMAVFSLPEGEVTEFSARLPSALAFIVFTLCFYRVVEKASSSREAFISALILMTSLEWFRAGIIARVDMVHGSLLAGGLLAVFFWKGERFPWVAALCFVGATLSKGPVGIVLPMLVYVANGLIERRQLKFIIRGVVTLFLPVLFLASIWYLFAFLDGSGRFYEKVYSENIARFTGTMEEESHVHGVFYLIGALLTGSLPWSLLLIPAALWRVRQTLSFSKMSQWFLSEAAFTRYALIVSLITFCFFSIPSSKRGVYLLSMYPFLAFLYSQILQRFVETRQIILRTQQGLVCLFLALCCGVLCVRIGMVSEQSLINAFGRIEDIKLLNSILREVVTWKTAALLGLPVVFSLLHFVSRKPTFLFFNALGFYATLLLVAHALFVPAVGRTVSPKAFIEELDATISKEPKLYSFNVDMYAISFYLKGRLLRMEESTVTSGLVFFRERDLEKLREFLGDRGSIEILKTSPRGVIKPKEKISVARIG